MAGSELATAVDIKTYSSGGDDRLRVIHIEGGDVADGKAVPRMNIRKANGGLNYS
jgi:hypothetical protein